MRRRDFISTLVAAGAGAATSRPSAQGGPVGTLIRRPYKPGGPELSIIGFGGIVVSQVEQLAANDSVAWAVDRGVNYFDVAPTYGNAQERLGPALKPYRAQSFLAGKTARRDAAGARAELEESLRLLETDRFELYQLHGVGSEEEVETILAPGGAMETLLRAREAGKVRYLGFSAHSVGAALKLLDAFAFDSVLFPFNCVCMENGGFGPQVMEKAIQRGAACLALKVLAWTAWPPDAEHPYPKCWYQPIDDRERARMALAYALSLPITAALPPGEDRLFRLAVELAQQFAPITNDVREALAQEMQGVQPIFKA